jgi:hypothetical protein
MSDTPSNTSGCSYTDGAQYVGCQVAEKGWPMPQSGGKRSKYKHCSKCGKVRSSKHSCMTKMTRNRSRTRKGGFIQQAMVPFGLFALQKRTEKRTQRKRSNKARGKSKKSKKSKRSKTSRKFRR